MIILAHRGFWHSAGEKNTLGAFERAFAAGYGAELDLRDLNGELVVSHDPPRRGCLSFAAVLALYRRYGMPGKLAINIKADGLAAALDAMLDEPALRQACFVFDMSVPDMLAYLAHGIPVFTRHSEYEAEPALLQSTQGVWVDAFTKPWADETRLQDFLAAGKAAALVSPELHAKPHAEAWTVWRKALRKASPAATVMLCTDHPDEAAQFFLEESLR